MIPLLIIEKKQKRWTSRMLLEQLQTTITVTLHSRIRTQSWISIQPHQCLKSIRLQMVVLQPLIRKYRRVPLLECRVMGQNGIMYQDDDDHDCASFFFITKMCATSYVTLFLTKTECLCRYKEKRLLPRWASETNFEREERHCSLKNPTLYLFLAPKSIGAPSVCLTLVSSARSSTSSSFCKQSECSRFFLTWLGVRRVSK